jgi:hypothetical protein
MARRDHPDTALERQQAIQQRRDGNLRPHLDDAAEKAQRGLGRETVAQPTEAGRGQPEIGQKIGLMRHDGAASASWPPTVPAGPMPCITPSP